MDKEIIILGVGHVFNIKDKIEKIISERSPHAIAIELDEERAAFLSGRPYINKKFPISFYRILSKYQEIIARKIGGELGGEMIEAIKIAKSKNIPLFYIDKKSTEVISRLWSELGLKEKLTFLFGIIFSLLQSRDKLERELNEIKERPDEFIREIGKNFPKIKKILVDERDEHMAKSIIELSNKYDKMVVIVGEGHIKGIKERINGRIDFEIIHLKNLL